ncbi:MmcQ/YjbR family DNA-binding protein [Nakamurella deserti]|uniref:MmcQ/YjbR family DNA-binding protein n=1 Tax=Nakamurella deserti TaxID=2164074 RepID=UPI000DBE36F8|nr:MmcQ/YjbR family DNA-binding protein [Nakamurella deserti]
MATAEDVRRIVGTLPGAAEKAAWGQPCFRVRDRIFASLDDGDQVLGFSIDRDERTGLIASDPDTYFLEPGHDDRYHFARARLPRLDEAELTEILTAAWRRIAPAARVRAFDEDHPPR